MLHVSTLPASAPTTHSRRSARAGMSRRAPDDVDDTANTTATCDGVTAAHGKATARPLPAKRHGPRDAQHTRREKDVATDDGQGALDQTTTYAHAPTKIDTSNGPPPPSPPSPLDTTGEEAGVDDERRGCEVATASGDTLAPHPYTPSEQQPSEPPSDADAKLGCHFGFKNCVWSLTFSCGALPRAPLLAPRPRVRNVHFSFNPWRAELPLSRQIRAPNGPT